MTASSLPPVISSKGFVVAAERDVQPEAADQVDVIRANGVGVTTAVRRFLLNSDRDQQVVRKHMLNDLNFILHPHYNFKEIQALQHEGRDNKWEIYFTTDFDQLVSLSQSGSGLKTVLCLLANVHLKMHAMDNPITEGVYILEELENSLHPRVQRNIYQYIRQKFSGDSVVLISTHSPIALDFFQSDDLVSFHQVYQDRGNARCRQIEAMADRLGALDALGVKASDALMSNFVVWVEGPTDRIYLNRWIRIVRPELREGRDYAVMFYGGRLLSHLTMTEDEEVGELIKLLRINPKCGIIIDSDRPAKGARIGETKKRLIDEATKHSRFCWLTKGRGIENYLSPSFLAASFAVHAEAFGEYADVFGVIGNKKAVKGGSMRSKVDLAVYVEKHAADCDFTLDWRERTEKLVAAIEAANA